MLNVLVIAIYPLTQGRKLDIIQLVSIRSLAPGHDMNATGTDHTLASNAKSFCIGRDAVSDPAAGINRRSEFGGKHS